MSSISEKKKTKSTQKALTSNHLQRPHLSRNNPSEPRMKSSDGKITSSRRGIENQKEKSP